MRHGKVTLDLECPCYNSETRMLLNFFTQAGQRGLPVSSFLICKMKIIMVPPPKTGVRISCFSLDNVVRMIPGT